MKYARLGNSELNVSRICMGCMGFGDAKNGQHTWTIDEEHTREIIRKGLESGINFYDTAIGYQSGTSEQYLGRALWDYAKRDEVVVATKFLPRTPEEIEQGVPAQEHIERMINKSLENLGMDHVDLYIYHMWDYATPLYDIMEGLNNVVKEGKARYIGISNCFAYQLAKANALAEREGFAKFVSKPDLPRGRTGDGETLPGRQYRNDAVQRPGRRQAVQKAGRNIKKAAGRRLCKAEIQRHSR